MYIVKRGKELILRRMYWNYSTGAAIFSGINYMVFGSGFDPNFMADTTTGLKAPALAIPITNAAIVTTPNLGLQFTTVIYESSIPNGFTAVLNEVALAYMSGTGYRTDFSDLSSWPYTIFNYARLHDLSVQGGAGGQYNIPITIYYP